MSRLRLKYVEIGIVFHPSLQLVSFIRDNFPEEDLREAVLFRVGPSALLIPSYIPLDVLAELYLVFVCAEPGSLLSLAPGSPENLGVITVDLALN